MLCCDCCEWHDNVCPKKEKKKVFLNDPYVYVKLIDRTPIVDLSSFKPAKIRSRCSRCGERYDSDEGHYCSPKPIEIEPVKSLLGPGTKPVSEWLREQHAPPRGTDARAIFDKVCPPPIVFDSMRCIIKVN